MQYLGTPFIKQRSRSPLHTTWGAAAFFLVTQKQLPPPLRSQPELTLRTHTHTLRLCSSIGEEGREGGPLDIAPAHTGCQAWGVEEEEEEGCCCRRLLLLLVRSTITALLHSSRRRLPSPRQKTDANLVLHGRFHFASESCRSCEIKWRHLLVSLQL